MHQLEALGGTLGVLDDGGRVPFRLVDEPGGGASRFGENVVGEALRLVDHALAVLFGVDHVLECVLDGARRRDVLELHGRDLKPGLVVIENLLQESLGAGLDLEAPLGQRVVDRARADHLAHGGFRRVTQRLLGVADLEEEVDRILDPVLNDEVELDDVAVGRQHTRFLGDVAIAGGRPDRDRTEADLFLEDAGDGEACRRARSERADASEGPAMWCG